MIRNILLSMLLLITANSFANAPTDGYYQTYNQYGECCNPPCCEKKCSKWGIYTAAGVAAILAGGIAGAAINKGKRGHKGSRGAPGPVPNFINDPGQNIALQASIVINVAGSSPNIRLTPFFSDPAGNTTKFPSFTVVASGTYSTPVMVAPDPFNGTYYWGFVVQATGADGTVFDFLSDDTVWVATPSRFGDSEFGILTINGTITLTGNGQINIELPGYIEYDKDAF